MFRIKKTSSFGKQKIDYFDIHPNYVHKIPFNELYLHLKLSDVRDGLTVTQINEAQSKYGLNRLQTEKQPNRIRLFLKETIKGFNVFLWVAAILAFLVDRLLENTNSDRTKYISYFKKDERSLISVHLFKFGPWNDFSIHYYTQWKFGCLSKNKIKKFNAHSFDHNIEISNCST